MHIPPYHKKKSWQLFLVGSVIGAIIAYFIIIYMYGEMYEKLLAENIELDAQVTKLKNHNDALLKDNKDLDEKSQEPLTVNAIELDIINGEELLLDRLLKRQLEELIKEEINHVIGQEVSVVGKSGQLLIATIENKEFTIDDFSYHFTINRIIIFETIHITLEAKLSS